MVAQAWNAPAVDKDFWHVLVAPGETKILSLEQLDDFFRLEVIDASTRVWQPGMTEWLPLSVVAGLEDEPAPAPTRAPPRPPAPPSRAPQQPRAGAQPTTAWPPQPAPVGTAPQAATAWPSQQPTAARPPAAQPAAAWPGSPPVTAQRAVSATPNNNGESLRPLVLQQSFAPAPPQGSRIGAILIGLAVVSASLVTLYRNDVLRSAAKSAGQERTYLQVERSLGSPGFGTPRAVEYLALLTPAFGSDSSPLRASAATRSSGSSPTSTSATSTPEPTSGAGFRASNTGSSSATGSTTTARATSESSKGSTTGTASQSPSLESLMAAQIGAPTTTKKKAASQRSHERPAPARRERPAREPGPGIKGSANRFDPLNGKL